MNDLDVFIIKQITGKDEVEIEKQISLYQKIIDELPKLELKYKEQTKELNILSNNLTLKEAEVKSYESLSDKVKKLNKEYKFLEDLIKKDNELLTRIKDNIEELSIQVVKTKEELTQIEHKKLNLMVLEDKERQLKKDRLLLQRDKNTLYQIVNRYNELVLKNKLTGCNIIEMIL